MNLMSQNNFFNITDIEASSDEQVIRSTDLNVDTSTYFTSSEAIKFSEEWMELIGDEYVMPFISGGPFQITLGLKYAPFMDIEDDLSTARVFAGIKDHCKTYRTCIELGFYMGRLFIDDKFDSISIDKEKLVEGVKLILKVDQEPDGGSSAVLSILDEDNILLTTLKSNKFLLTDWVGRISPGAHFRSLYLERY